MGCRCNERATSLTRTAKAIAKGDGQAVAAELKFITTTAAQDVASTFREKAAAARSRLMQRRR